MVNEGGKLCLKSFDKGSAGISRKRYASTETHIMHLLFKNSLHTVIQSMEENSPILYTSFSLGLSGQGEFPSMG